MDCKKVQEILLTDYIDEQLDRSGKQQIEAHLQGCAACREFLTAARQAFVEPFAQVPREHLSERVISSVMEQVQPSPDPLAWIHEFLDGINGVKWAVPSFALLLIAIIVVGSNNDRLARKNEQVSSFVEVAVLSSAENGVVADYGTTIEEYFLGDSLSPVSL